MGYYVQLPMKQHKAMQLVADYGGQIVESPKNLGEIPANKALICVVENDLFDAALLCYNEGELQATKDDRSGRNMFYVVMDRHLAHEMASYRE